MFNRRVVPAKIAAATRAVFPGTGNLMLLSVTVVATIQ
jgi:hypothetical protein